MEQTMGSEKFLENIPTVIPGPLKLSFIRIQNVLENASRVPYLTFQSIHVARSLLHLLVATAQAIPNAKVLSQADLSECIELRRNLTELALLFDDILSPGQFEVTSKLESWQERLGNIFTTLTTRTHGASVIIQSEAVFWGLGSIDRRRSRTVHLGDTLSPNEATSNPVLEGSPLVLYIGKTDDASISSKHPLSTHDPYMSQSTASAEAFLSPIRQAYDSQATMDDLYYSVSDQGRPLVMQATARDKHGHKATSNSAPATSQSDVPMDEAEDVTANARSLPSVYLRRPLHDVPLPHLTSIIQRTNVSQSMQFDSSSVKPTDQPDDVIETWRLPESLSDVASGDVNLQHEETSTSALEVPQSDVPMDEADATTNSRNLLSDFLPSTPSLYWVSMDPVAPYIQTGGPSTSLENDQKSSTGDQYSHEMESKGTFDMSPLLKDEFGYVEPVEAWKRCIQKPPLPTKEFDVQFFPPGDASLRTENGRRCQVRARVSTAGRAVWAYSREPCNAVLNSVDSYRRHVILCHLGCHRGDSNGTVNWIVNRWSEHDRNSKHFQYEAKSTSVLEGSQSDVPMDEGEDATMNARNLLPDYLPSTPSQYWVEPLSMDFVAQHLQTGGASTSSEKVQKPSTGDQYDHESESIETMSVQRDKDLWSPLSQPVSISANRHARLYNSPSKMISVPQTALPPSQAYTLPMSSTSDVHPSIMSLTRLPPRSQRLIRIPGFTLPIPMYYLQVPASLVISIQGSLSPPPAIWPAYTPPDTDGLSTWRLVFANNETIYIRSQPAPRDPPGICALAPNQDEIFIPQALLPFYIANLNPAVPALPPPSSIEGPTNAPTLLSRNANQTFRGRKCRMCQHQDRHGPFCASTHGNFSCPWCAKTNGSHELSCSGFSPEY